MSTKEQHEQSQKDLQIRQLGLYSESSTVIRIECGHCGQAEEDIYEHAKSKEELAKLKNNFASDCYSDGWVYTAYGMVGVMCPDCVKAKEAEKLQYNLFEEEK